MDEPTTETSSGALRNLVTQVAAAYFANSHVGPTEIPGVISQIAASLAAVGEPSVSAPPSTQADNHVPALTRGQIRKSITPDALISFEDRKPYKTLRRHLAVRGMTPAEYRAKWGLPNDYPMVSPNYSAARSELAKNFGLGQRIQAARQSGGGGRGRRADPAPTES